MTTQAEQVTYGYEPNVHLIQTIDFGQGTGAPYANRMTTTRQHDLMKRLWKTTSSPEGTNAQPVSVAYGYNNANQRIRATQQDRTFWSYRYDELGQVISGRKYWGDGSPVAGQQFDYGFDDLGNRQETANGGDENGLNLRTTDYTVSNYGLNQYTNRMNPRYLEVLGLGTITVTVTVGGSGQSVYRKGEYFRSEAFISGTSAAYPAVSVSVSGGGTSGGDVFVPPSTEQVNLRPGRQPDQ